MNNFWVANLGKTISTLSKLSNRGSGSTWPGHIALGLNNTYIKDLLQTAPTQIILIVGTNGKTTTGKILTTILQKQKKKVIQNSSGANLLNGIASSLLLGTTFSGDLQADYAIFEVDENNLPLVLKELTPKAIAVLDLFRDQLDRYGEIDSIAEKWEKAFEKLPSSTHLILNADDPLVAYLGQNTKAAVSYFGLDQTAENGADSQQAADSLYCPRCNNKLVFQKVFYSHLGVWKCHYCKLQRPLPALASTYYPLAGTYNKYNALAASLTAKTLGVSDDHILQALHTVTAAFGRQEKLSVQGKKVQIFLAKNPTSFNESLRTIAEEGAKHALLVLNDRIPDGRDVSWIWDIDFESYAGNFSSITISGDRTYDMALRVAYAFPAQEKATYLPETSLHHAVHVALSQLGKNETLYILPTYSAMLEVRKILTGKKIL